MTTETNNKRLANQLAEQLDFHWTNQMRPRLDGLTDDEYFWCPVPNCWTVQPDGSIDFTYPEPQPAPFTTIAWRLAHVIVGVLAMRNHSHFGGPPADYQSWPYATDAATALRQLDDAYADWIAGVRGARRRRAVPAVRAGRRALRRVSDQRPDPAHQSRDDPSRRRNRLHPRPLREHPREEGEVVDARNATTRQATSVRPCSNSFGSTRTPSSRWPTG